MSDDIIGKLNKINYNYDDMTVKVDPPEWINQVQSINNNVSNISENVTTIKADVHSLEDTVRHLNSELEEERSKSDKIARNSKVFTILMSFLSVLLSIGIPRFISWLEKLLS